MRRLPSEDLGQASVELLAGAAVLLLVGLLAFQLLAIGYAAVMADHAAEAAALALANGRNARAAVPGWPPGAASVRTSGGRVFVTLVPPSPLRVLRDRLAATGEAAVRLPPNEEE